MQTKNTRRIFLKNAVLGGISAVAAPHLPLMSVENTFPVKEQLNRQRFLFEGGSITDGNRGRNNDPNHVMGRGYAFSIASRADVAFPEKALIFYTTAALAATQYPI